MGSTFRQTIRETLRFSTIRQTLRAEGGVGPPVPSEVALLLEDDSNLLLEDGSNLLLEA